MQYYDVITKQSHVISRLQSVLNDTIRYDRRD